jgi:hypothetical protein
MTFGAKMPCTFQTDGSSRASIAPAAGSVWLGPTFEYAEDLHSTTRSYSYREQGEGWFDGQQYDDRVTDRVRVGQSRVSIVATIGGTIPL